jgi:hypothetical protein
MDDGLPQVEELIGDGSIAPGPDRAQQQRQLKHDLIREQRRGAADKI